MAVRQKTIAMVMEEDFGHFKKLKDNLSGREFEDRVSLVRSIFQYLEDIPKDELRKTFENRIKRQNSVVDCKGE